MENDCIEIGMKRENKIKEERTTTIRKNKFVE
jgi:hypothetical protein